MGWWLAGLALTVGYFLCMTIIGLPFGFALFYLRSVAPRGSYIDKVTGIKTAGVSTGEIYWGAVPFVIIQVVMVGLVIAFPQMVMHYKSSGVVVDEKKALEQLQNLSPGLELPPLDLGPPKIQ